MPRDLRNALIAAWFLPALAITLAISCIPAAYSQQGTGPIPTGAGSYGPNFQNNAGHMVLGGGAPPALNAACGTNPSGPFGTDSAFHFVSGTGTSGTCTITPSVAWSKRPTCSLDSEAGSAAYSVGPTGAIVLSGVADATRYFVVCIGQPGGL